MTVNIALLTDDAIVFGCDSIASTTSPLIDPFNSNHTLKRSKEDPSRSLLEFDNNAIIQYVTNTWSGVTKLFTIHDGNTPVAAVTAGLAKLNGKTMEQLAHEFFQTSSKRNPKLVRVATVTNAFLRFLRKEFDDQYKNSKMNEKFWIGPEFLVGGYGRDDSSPSLFKINVKGNIVSRVYSGGESGVAWNGQSNAVERFLRGYDQGCNNSIQEQHADELHKAHVFMSKKMLKILAEITKKTGVTLPKDLDVRLTPPRIKRIIMTNSHTNIAYNSLPLQSAIDLVSHLVNLQSAHSQFESGIPTVGGRILLGIITKSNGLKILGKPDLVHDHVGV